MSCINNCRLCNNLVISANITYDEASDTVQVNLPQRNFNNFEKICLVLAQNFPTDATIDSPVVITIGDDETTTYQLVNRDGTPIYITQLRTRTIYQLGIKTTPTTGVFVYIGNRKLPNNNVVMTEAIPIPATGDGTKTVVTPTTGGGKSNG